MTPSRQEIAHSKSASSSSTSTPTTPTKEIDQSDHPPAIMSSESVDRQVRETRIIPTYLIGCKNSERISWMKEFLNTETHTRVLLMKWIWVSTVLKLNSRKTEIARSARGPKSQGPRAEDVLAESYFMQKNLVVSLQTITKLSVKVVNLETFIDKQSWWRSWPPNGSSHIRAKQKLHKKHKEACSSSWSQIGSLKSFTLTIP